MIHFGAIRKLFWGLIPLILMGCVPMESAHGESTRIYTYLGFNTESETLSIIVNNNAVFASWGDSAINAKVNFDDGLDFSIPDLGYILRTPIGFNTNLPKPLSSELAEWSYDGCNYSVRGSQPIKLNGPSSYFYFIDATCVGMEGVNRFMYSSDYGLFGFFRGEYIKHDDDSEHLIATEGFFLVGTGHGIGNSFQSN